MKHLLMIPPSANIDAIDATIVMILLVILLVILLIVDASINETNQNSCKCNRYNPISNVLDINDIINLSV